MDSQVAATTESGRQRGWALAPRQLSRAARRVTRSAALRLASLVALSTVVSSGLIVLGILFKVLDANMRKWLVSDVSDAASWLTGPFHDTFMVHDAKLATTLNWGIAIVVYAILGRLVVMLIRRAAERL